MHKLRITARTSEEDKKKPKRKKAPNPELFFMTLSEGAIYSILRNFNIRAFCSCFTSRALRQCAQHKDGLVTQMGAALDSTPRSVALIYLRSCFAFVRAG